MVAAHCCFLVQVSVMMLRSRSPSRSTAHVHDPVAVLGNQCCRSLCQQGVSNNFLRFRMGCHGLPGDFGSWTRIPRADQLTVDVNLCLSSLRAPQYWTSFPFSETAVGPVTQVTCLEEIPVATQLTPTLRPTIIGPQMTFKEEMPVTSHLMCKEGVPLTRQMESVLSQIVLGPQLTCTEEAQVGRQTIPHPTMQEEAPARIIPHLTMEETPDTAQTIQRPTMEETPVTAQMIRHHMTAEETPLATEICDKRRRLEEYYNPPSSFTKPSAEEIHREGTNFGHLTFGSQGGQNKRSQTGEDKYS